ncbi:hypothetical protein Skr01_61960 [Sphaerisporangium krabiense]|uniref:Amino acid adenylation domain-containing protein n=1 Tax=Sphaerisporangium krabiense TaxID=763782 RepID=A0A7W8Z2L9_9ACTN|nr:non-ribosomal peptide synthetase [Sphaerisporangium krabiense]MBB5626222.1 amino acid adenylation domain-containing protein [Sphaerisporangium krabiense]GII66111.1 hypothetical protein Skr01_61960 [Sphaerisporangium krabiense]
MSDVEPGSVVELVRRTVRALPEHTAIVTPAGPVTYGELGSRAGAVAARLRALGVGAGRRVGVLASPSAEGVVGLLGVAMAGAAYVPLCPSLPSARLRALAEDSGASLVLHAEAAAGQAALGVTALPITDGDAAGQDAPVEIDPESPVSVIYTSGSSGTPKGVIVPHRALANRVLWGQSVYPLAPHDRVLQHTRYIYDFSAWEVFATLSFGATLVAPELANYPDFNELAEAMERHAVTTAHFVPSVLSGVINREAFARCAKLSLVFSGGETLTKDLARRFRARSAATLFNQYGPTETCVDSTFHRYEPGDGDAEGAVPIGTAIDRTRLHVLDERLEPVPDGTEGELFVAGAGLATGYLGRPGLTAERFLPDPYGAPGTRMYRTGDLVVRDGRGRLEFRGRADLQVNLRGVRVELEEVESVLALDDDVERAVAVVTDDGSPSLVAMVFPADGAVVETAKVREAARRRLPAAFVPDQVLLGDRPPLLPTGKVDRAAVRALILETRRAGRGRRGEGTGPGEGVEPFVVGLWKEYLELEEFGTDESFFELGGHSLLAVEMVSAVGEHLGSEVSLAEFFEEPTVATMVRLATSAVRDVRDAREESRA